jgi:hypothetical protein
MAGGVTVSKRRAARLVTAVAVVLAGGLLTAGCTPAPLGLAGIILREGHPTVLVRPCPGIAVTQVWVYQRASDLRWGAVDSGGHPVTDVRLLQAPAGWTEPDVPAAQRLGALSPAVTYQVQLATDHPERGGIDLVEFTVSDLSDAAVWVTQPHGPRQAVSAAEFDRQAAEACG